MPHVEGRIDEIGLGAEGLRDIPRDQESKRSALLPPVGLPWLDPMPADVGKAASPGVYFVREELRTAQLAVPPAEVGQQRYKAPEPRAIPNAHGLLRPVKPVPFLIMAVGVVVSPLGATQFIPHGEHGNPLAQEEQGHRVALQTGSEFPDGGLVGLPLNAAVP